MTEGENMLANKRAFDTSEQNTLAAALQNLGFEGTIHFRQRTKDVIQGPLKSIGASSLISTGFGFQVLILLLIENKTLSK